MEDRWQHAFGDVVHAEIGLRRLTQKRVYTDLGMSSSVWRNYVVTCDRPIPSSVMIDLAGYFGMPLSTLIARTEARVAEVEPHHDPTTDELEANLSSRARRALDRSRAANRHDPADEAEEDRSATG